MSKLSCVRWPTFLQSNSTITTSTTILCPKYLPATSALHPLLFLSSFFKGKFQGFNFWSHIKTAYNFALITCLLKPDVRSSMCLITPKYIPVSMDVIFEASSEETTSPWHEQFWSLNFREDHADTGVAYCTRVDPSSFRSTVSARRLSPWPLVTDCQASPKVFHTPSKEEARQSHLFQKNMEWTRSVEFPGASGQVFGRGHHLGMQNNFLHARSP